MDRISQGNVIQFPRPHRPDNAKVDLVRVLTNGEPNCQLLDHGDGFYTITDPNGVEIYNIVPSIPARRRMTGGRHGG